MQMQMQMQTPAIRASPTTGSRRPLFGLKGRRRRESGRRERGGTTPGATNPNEETVQLSLSLVDSIESIGKEAWDACAGTSNPLNGFTFLDALERSKSACVTSGWAPQHLAVKVEGGATVAVAPLYLKGHPYGEFVFDSQFGAFWEDNLPDRPYYPKLISAVPFTPCTCSKLLVNAVELASTGMSEQELVAAVVNTIGTLPRRMGISSVHVNFIPDDEVELFAERGFIKRANLQYHWTNEEYASFDNFLAGLKQRRRKTIRQERKRVNGSLDVRRLTGDRLKSPALWDRFYEYYENTIDAYYSQAYLTRDFFDRISETMADNILLVAAYESSTDPDDVPIAAALNFVGEDCLYGRNWGCRADVDFGGLHMELCYYQAIEFAIERSLARVEAGAQGEETKLPRGYLPTPTYSAHVFDQIDVSAAINNYCRREEAALLQRRDMLLGEANPYKRTIRL